MEIDAANNMERFSTGSGADEAVEVHDFEIVSARSEIRFRLKKKKKQKSRVIGTLSEQFGRRSRSDLLKL